MLLVISDCTTHGLIQWNKTSVGIGLVGGVLYIAVEVPTTDDIYAKVLR